MESQERRLTSGRRPPQQARQRKLASHLLEQLVDSQFPPGCKFEFLPKACIDRLVSREAIIQELSDPANPFKPEDEAFIQWILHKARKLFLTILDSRLVEGPSEKLYLLDCFQARGLDDDQMPWTDSSSFLPIDDIENETWFHNLWSKEMDKNFRRSQWRFVVPVITSTQFIYRLQAHQVLPFLQVFGSPKEGAFGRVYCVQVEQSHIDIGLPVKRIAVKEITNPTQQRETVAEAWPNEVRVLEKTKSLSDPHLITCIAAIERGNERYLLFPWAQDGNLREYWETPSERFYGRAAITEALVQLKGLATALRHLHYFGLSDDLADLPASVKDEYDQTRVDNSIRHGDLKPENLLWFLEATPGSKETRYLKIADMGLAKRHVIATQDRSCLTSTRYGTILYEAPEAQTSDSGRSRQYDVWSMGCITLEWVIWILYGNSQLQRFYSHLKGYGNDFTPYYQLDANYSQKRAKVHPAVVHWISHIKTTHAECQEESAIKDLLQLVEERLLVVPLPVRRPTTLLDTSRQSNQSPLPDSQDVPNQPRATSKEFENAMNVILEKVGSKASTLGKGLAPPSTGSRVSKVYHFQLEKWEFPIDNTFAKKVIRDTHGGSWFPAHTSSTAELCHRCRSLDFSNPGLDITRDSGELEQGSQHCELCSLLCHVWSQSLSTQQGAIQGTVCFERTGSLLKMFGVQHEPMPALSLTAHHAAPSPTSIQIGLPNLPESGSEQHLQIIRKWLDDCDGNHGGCKFEGVVSLPTRLIDVGSRGSPILRLVETADRALDDKRYIALSHRWGDTKEHPPFCTRFKDPTSRGHDLQSFKMALPQDDVPQTFKDAIDVTRRLGIRYLWIDSLCIVQGEGGDFNTEAKRMEDVFSCAYCVIAASRASNQLEGFIKERPKRKFVTIKQGRAPPLYVCEAIDNFGGHILEGALNRRGWVLQERALARRTVYFADAQTYFECGEGVRCETMTKMQNTMADLLGDARFPDKAMRTQSRGLKIRYFQALYQQYSRLELSHIQDRPLAIAGLESRLRKAYRLRDDDWAKGGYGIFHDGPGHGLFHRSLLWKRSEDEPVLELIDFSRRPEDSMPTWSWMAFKGGIDYLDPPFNKVDWEMTEVESPWSRKSGGSEGTLSSHHLKVTARPFNVAGHRPGEIELIYDNPERKATSEGYRPKCAIVAKSKEGVDRNEKSFYVMILIEVPNMDSQGQQVFRRLGVGRMMGKYISWEESLQKGVVS
ncbi:serine/threonine protein kinase [Fusarium oxysporum f. sp. raphani 54005]|uniref:Serine/threonine protein kinase n=1 Tax=Fusarium oxysporum f. sp. raphani 54005 TaxID=1089458 RepID=X0BRK5_FUSOX|nr:serine/threonine protein kinase [Fusarium oxysporum f. sp. raphani 54005]